MKNPYLPELATITNIIEETPNIKSFHVVFNDPEKMKNFKFEPGQVGQLSVFGVGESTFVINSPPTRMEYLQFSVMKAGEVTNAIHELYVGDQIGVRAPLGNWFPYEQMKGKKILFIGGGIGLAPLRTLILFMLDNRKDYDDITILYGARTPPDLCYKDDLKEWESRSDVNLILTVDTEYPGWTKRTGFVPTVLNEIAPSPENTIAITCGPPIMIKFVLQNLVKLNFKDEQIITTLEKRMKCGIGICGRCNIGSKYVCKDGPVFSLDQLKALPPEL
ncbi:MAG TPA: FAD/NAD(P)-binding protein [Syntrophorhabdaceae bacterium]|nr:FAD/NAD(P)-binding protein [Syntrophorhabdaceae bacterium]HOL05616.1 FAD/NAD(P)-binding protein [Syntrophorhabdaceae bacterium]HON84984.1 FAD/NAD(P)-binding protein [Syntrophorhabdaceae bacterium]HOT41677.1 FAD/NAD(P)-binding protein [Syntrophorhabdaceae bacterium]HPC66631.1 FAD/NAD(P)-binding protein [Syntrophorhabdaceae bacterium]